MQLAIPAPVVAATPRPMPTAPAPTAPTTSAPAAPTKPDAPQAPTAPGAPAGSAPPADAAAAKQAAMEKLTKTSAVDAIAEIDSHLAKVSSLTIGGGTPAGVDAAKTATALLTDASMLLQHAHTKTIEQLKNLTAELHVKLMSSAAGLAFMGGQIAVAGQSKTPVNLADVAAGPINETKAAMVEVLTALNALTPAAPSAPAAPNGTSPAPAAGPAPVPTPITANGNTGVVQPTPKYV